MISDTRQIFSSPESERKTEVNSKKNDKSTHEISCSPDNTKNVVGKSKRSFENEFPTVDKRRVNVSKKRWLYRWGQKEGYERLEPFVSVNEKTTHHPFGRDSLTDDQRHHLETLDNQDCCFVRNTKISGDPEQLRPGTLLYNGVPMKLFYPDIYTTEAEIIGITIPAEYLVALYKKNAYSRSLVHKKNHITGLGGYQHFLVEKTQEYSERICQPIYPSVSSGKIMVENHEVCFSTPKTKPFNSDRESILPYNEVIRLPFKPAQVQSILVTKKEFLWYLDQLLIRKSAYEARHDLQDLPITIYDCQTGEKIHCYECQLFRHEQREKFLANLKLIRNLLIENRLLADGTNNSIKAWNGLSYLEFIDVITNLQPDLLSFKLKRSDELINLIKYPQSESGWLKFGELISGGANINSYVFREGFNYTERVDCFLESFIRLSCEQSSDLKKLKDEYLVYYQELFYLILNLPLNSENRDSIKLCKLSSEFITILLQVDPNLLYQRFKMWKRFSGDLFYFAVHGINKINIDSNVHIYLIHNLFKINKNDPGFYREVFEMMCQLDEVPRLCLLEPDFKVIINELLHYQSIEQWKPFIRKALEYNCKTNPAYIHEDHLNTWFVLGVDLTFKKDKGESSPFLINKKNINRVASLCCERICQAWSEYQQSEEYQKWPEQVEQANNQLPALPEYLRKIILPTPPDNTPLDNPQMYECLKRPFLQPLPIPDFDNPYQTARLILDRYYRCSGPNRLKNLPALTKGRSPLHGVGHVVRTSVNIRLLMQLLVTLGLVRLSKQQQQLLEYASLYHDSAAEDVPKDKEESGSAKYYSRDMIHNFPDKTADINAIANAMAHKEDDVSTDERSIDPQQRLYRRLLRFADRLEIARCLKIPDDFPNFERQSGSTDTEIDVSMLDIHPDWLGQEKFRKMLEACIHGLVDLAAVSGGARYDLRSGKRYVRNYQLNLNVSDTLNQFFEKSPNPLMAIERLLDDNVRRCIAKQAGITTCGDPEHNFCNPKQKQEQEKVDVSYTRYIHNSYHDLAQVQLPANMKFWEKLCLEHAPGLLTAETRRAVDNEVTQLKDGIKRNIGNPSQETLGHPSVKQFLQKEYGLEVIAKKRVREVITNHTEDGSVAYRYEMVLMPRPVNNPRGV